MAHQDATAAPGTTAALPPGLRIEPVPAFQDNYIWVLRQGGAAVAVDPGDARPLEAYLHAQGLRLDAILVTHHHGDHVGGVAELVAATGAAVYGPADSPFRGSTRPLRDGDRLQLFGHEFHVLAVPGHTLDHLAYWSPALGVLFCGDTLFACGCGRLFEGSAAQMHASLARLAALPGATRVYCTHEYTLSNLRFALAVEPGNAALQERQRQCAGLRERGLPTLPSTVDLERRTNPFLRCDQAEVRASARASAAQALAPGGLDGETAVFAALRAWKDRF